MEKNNININFWAGDVKWRRRRELYGKTEKSEYCVIIMLFYTFPFPESTNSKNLSYFAYLRCPQQCHFTNTCTFGCFISTSLQKRFHMMDECLMPFFILRCSLFSPFPSFQIYIILATSQNLIVTKHFRLFTKD